MRSFLLALAVSLSVVATAQNFEFAVVNRWVETPKLHPAVAKFDSSSAVGILDDRKIEYVVDKNEAYINATYHKIIRINSDRGIEMYNKIYIPIYRNAEITDVKARTIQKNGKVINLPSDKIKEIEDDGRMYKLFAMEGVEKGSEVEYTYSTKRPLSFFGMEIYQGKNIPYETEYFTLIGPEHLKFDVKGYNGFKVSTDSLINGKRMIVGFDKEVEQMEDEKYANLNGFLKRVQYKLSYNISNATPTRMYTWKEFAKKAFSIYTTYNSKEEKALDNLARQIDVSGAKSDEEKILLIEDYVKNNYNISEKVIGEDAEALDRVVKTRNTNRDGSIRLFTGLFDRFSIPYQIVYPSDREDFPIDEELENWNTTEEIVFYFPKTGKYLAPVSAELRYPYIPANLAGSQGLFLKTTTIGSFRTAVAAFNDIEMLPFEEHAMNMEADVKFDATLDTLMITSKQILKGYGANSYRPIYTFLPKDKQEEVNKEIIKSVGNSTNVSNIKVENAAFTDYFTNKPLIISGDIKNTELLEKAGNKILVKLGEIIGPQEQMYQEKPRKLPIELDYPHMLERNISFEIPAGYVVKNLDDLKFDIEYKDGDEITMGFISTYTVSGNVVSVNVKEIYKRLRYPITEFEHFKKVINGAADFNKVTLVLEHK